MSVFTQANVINALAVTGTNSYYSPVQKIQNVRDCSYQLSWTGTPTGTFAVWVSNKFLPDTTTDNDWVQLSLAVAIVQPAGAASKDIADISAAPFMHMRLKYVNASGSGTITADFCGKGL